MRRLIIVSSLILSGCASPAAQHAQAMPITPEFRVGQTWRCPATEWTPELDFTIGAVSWENGAHGGPTAPRVANIGLFAPPTILDDQAIVRTFNVNGAHVPFSEEALAACGPVRADADRPLPDAFQVGYEEWLAKADGSPGGYFTDSVPSFYFIVVAAAEAAVEVQQ